MQNPKVQTHEHVMLMFDFIKYFIFVERFAALFRKGEIIALYGVQLVFFVCLCG